MNTLNVVRHLNTQRSADQHIKVVGLAADSSVDKVIKQAREFDVQAIALADPSSADLAKLALPQATVFAGPNACLQLVESVGASDIAAAVVGAAGLPATLSGVKQGATIGLANKETLVAAGSLVTPLVRKHKAQLIPVDSEHSAIFQCLQSSGSPGQVTNSVKHIKRIVLTASGGPFRTASKADMENVTVEQALNHPTWNMGPKVTIDSATMMNKALEIIEAHWLFGLPGDKIDVVIHPQSIVHSFVEFEDHSILAQLGSPDMKTPIQYALTYPDRAAGCSQALDWSKLTKLDFDSPDHKQFPALALAYDVINIGGTAGAVFNAANEAAVSAFLERRIRFGRIVELVAEALSAITPTPANTLDVIMEADQAARMYVNQRANRN